MVDVVRLEYIWLDGSADKLYEDGYAMPRLRSKWRFIKGAESRSSFEPQFWTGGKEGVGIGIPGWGMDGSSTLQAITKPSDRPLKPVKVIENPFVTHPGYKSLAVLCEVMDRDGVTPHETNTRAALVDLEKRIKDELIDTGEMVSFEQEYTLFDPKTRLPFGWTEDPAQWPKEGLHYCGESRRFGLDIAHAHANACIEAEDSLGLIYGGNPEVMPSQFEFQTPPRGFVENADSLVLMRWILEGVAAQHGAKESYHPKPSAHILEILTDEQKKAMVKALNLKNPEDFVMNGAGCHINWSNKRIRDGDTSYRQEIISRLVDQDNHRFLISGYGEGNELRMTGECETAKIDEATYGEAHRGASLRTPDIVGGNKDRLEDRRVSANHDPYVSIGHFARVVYFPEDIPKTLHKVNAPIKLPVAVK